MKQFKVPDFYKSPIISRIKAVRKEMDPKKKDMSPTVLNFGSIEFLIARHFGFCYGVENAIEISYRAISENLGKRIFLLSEMIHNPAVNADLQARGIKFIMDTKGKQLISWNEIKQEDIVIIPAFGTTIEINDILKSKNIEPKAYNTTCPFVERVWKMSNKLSQNDYTIVIHGKHNHEETRATFSHSSDDGPSVIVKDLSEAKELAKYIRQELSDKEFFVQFDGKFSKGFTPSKHLSKIGVINQTTMLATETKEIAEYLKNEVEKYHGEGKETFADTRDSLCYATNDNQNATIGLLEEQADLAIVVGGYNSSNTTHLVELCEEKLPTYFINGHDNIISKKELSHFLWQTKKNINTSDYLPRKEKIRIILTSGASCPDAEVDKVLTKLLSFFEGTKSSEEVLSEIEKKTTT
ncbi:MAG: 4-hydroxy-3-methylbut-2-enyl diphosphate reductase [Saprospiraceae bacterium]|jgi:4-hydroxy-3-methylbut-2-enyl diphosphate reductase